LVRVNIAPFEFMGDKFAEIHVFMFWDTEYLSAAGLQMFDHWLLVALWEDKMMLSLVGIGTICNITQTEEKDEGIVIKDLWYLKQLHHDVVVILDAKLLQSSILIISMNLAKECTVELVPDSYAFDCNLAFLEVLHRYHYFFEFV